MLVPSFLVFRNNPDMPLETQPAQVMRLPPVTFLGRRAALAIIAKIPEIERKFGMGRSDWMDGSMVSNERRKQWLAEVTVAGLERALKMEVLYLKVLENSCASTWC